jgi:holo-[acyl-carrier protein] synthase
MIIGLGADLTDIRRIQSSLDRYGERFRRRCFTELERARSDRKPDPAWSYAKRFAAKEACAKALGTGMRRAHPASDRTRRRTPGATDAARA